MKSKIKSNENQILHNGNLINYEKVPAKESANDELSNTKILISCNSIEINKKKSKFKLNNPAMILKKYWKSTVLAQILSFVIWGTGVVNSQLSEKYNINIPTSQSVLNYILLSIVFVPCWILKINNKTQLKKSFLKNWYKYFLIAFADVEANYFVIKAYSLTIMTTIQVIDAFILPITLILSYALLKQSFKLNHLMGVCGCLFGCGFIIFADFLIKGVNGEHKILGDIYCLIGSILYAVSNVGAEFFIKENSKTEYLAMIGIFSSLISSIQMAIFERNELSSLLEFNNLNVWLLFVLESAFMFLIYTLIPCVIQLSSAAYLNLNLLTSDFYSVLYGIFIQKYKLHSLYFAGFACILLGTILYSITEPKNRISNQTEIDIEKNNNKFRINTNHFSINNNLNDENKKKLFITTNNNNNNK